MPDAQAGKQPRDLAVPPSPFTVEQCVAAWQRTIAAVQADPALADDESALLAILQIDPNVLTPEQLLRRIVRAIRVAGARHDDAELWKREAASIMVRYAKRIEFLRVLACDIMQVTEHQSVSTPWGTLSLTDSRRSVIIMDEEKLADEYVRIKREPDKLAIKADLEQGVMIEGAVLSNTAKTVRLTKPRLLTEALTDEEG